MSINELAAQQDELDGDLCRINYRGKVYRFKYFGPSFDADIMPIADKIYDGLMEGTHSVLANDLGDFMWLLLKENNQVERSETDEIANIKTVREAYKKWMMLTE